CYLPATEPATGASNRAASSSVLLPPRAREPNRAQNMGAKLRRVKVFDPHPLSPSPPCGEGELGTALSSPLSAWRRCHPEQARGTRASEGPACGRPSRKAAPSHLRESRRRTG